MPSPGQIGQLSPQMREILEDAFAPKRPADLALTPGEAELIHSMLIEAARVVRSSGAEESRFYEALLAFERACPFPLPERPAPLPPRTLAWLERLNASVYPEGYVGVPLPPTYPTKKGVHLIRRMLPEVMRRG